VKINRWLSATLGVVALVACVPPQNAPRTEASVYDYQTFQNRSVQPLKAQAWEKDAAYNTQPVSRAQQQVLDGFGTLGYLIVQNGKLLHEQYLNAHDETRISGLFSVTKSIVSLLIGIALEEGAISSLDQPVAAFVPAFKTGGRDTITIHHLLTMNSGLRWDESYALGSSVANAYLSDDVGTLVSKLEPERAPGTRWVYSSGDTQLLGLVLEAATKRTLSAYLQDKLWRPLGAEREALWNLDRTDGREKAFCCLTTTARDLARFGQLVLQNGAWNGQQLVSKAYLEAATRAVPNSDGAYGFQFWLSEYKKLRLVMMVGILGQYVIVIPEKNAVIVRLGERDDWRGTDFNAYMDAALERLK
jgi:CubicO group peptidase (beta-lactamase class C family)